MDLDAWNAEVATCHRCEAIGYAAEAVHNSNPDHDRPYGRRWHTWRDPET